MAKLETLPEKYIIDGFKGTIDFYEWKGIPVARKWPTFQPYPFSEAQKDNQAAFAYINKLYSQLSLSVIVAYTLLAARTTQTPKDYIVRAYMKGMFAIMPPEYYMTEETGLAILAQLDVALSTRALEAGGNLETIKDDIILLKDLRDALSSIATKRLQVEAKGGDKIFAFESIVEESKYYGIPGAGNYTLDGSPVPSGKVWMLTHATIRYDGTPPTSMELYILGLAASMTLIGRFVPASGVWYTWTGQIYPQAGDYLQLSVVGATGTDGIYLRYCGVQMDEP